MAIYTNLPIYKATYSLMLNVSKIIPNLPRDCRYTFAQDLRNKIMEIIILIYNANRHRDKLHLILKMRETLIEVQVYLRIMNDLHYISEKKYLIFAEETTAMSKQMSAWENSELKKMANNSIS